MPTPGLIFHDNIKFLTATIDFVAFFKFFCIQCFDSCFIRGGGGGGD